MKTSTKEKEIKYFNFENVIFLPLHSMLKCTLTEVGERYAYKDKCSRTKQCAFDRFECTLTKIYVHSQQS